MTKGYFETLPGLPADVLAIEAKGTIDAEAYSRDLIPAIEAKIAAEGRLKLLYVIGAAFESYTAGAAWEDAKVGMMHLGDFARIALVSDVEWIRLGMKAFAPMIPGAVKVFALSDLAAAKAWIAEDGHDQTGSPGIAADYTIPPLEDRIPEEP
ncbi:SpoIIAA-like protein [Rhodobacter sp. 140A]|uniref:STAS/SEC14 domain-containing protein n=1 Tax=bioreactor metagenome TaxID=1076179 RepID=A0A644U9B1_9ZZZZ|nr:SpoIIAA-like protein [Rhodobacter sp. 140A]